MPKATRNYNLMTMDRIQGLLPRGTWTEKQAGGGTALYTENEHGDVVELARGCDVLLVYEEALGKIPNRRWGGRVKRY